jgi:hypothetical protein
MPDFLSPIQMPQKVSLLMNLLGIKAVSSFFFVVTEER